MALQVGLLGLVEFEWITTLATLSPADVTYIDFITEGRRLATELRVQTRVHATRLLGVTVYKKISFAWLAYSQSSIAQASRVPCIAALRLSFLPQSCSTGTTVTPDYISKEQSR